MRAINYIVNADTHMLIVINKNIGLHDHISVIGSNIGLHVHISVIGSNIGLWDQI